MTRLDDPAEVATTGLANSPPSRRIEADLACVRCGYNLRGMARGERCPECGTPVVASSDNPFAAFDALDLRRRARGVAGLVWLIAMTVVLTVNADYSVVEDLGEFLIVAFTTCATLIVAALVGLAFLPAGGDRIVWAIRALVLAAAALYFLPVIARLENELEVATFLMLAMASLWAAIICQFLLLRRWARRMADRRLASAAGFCGLAVVASLVANALYKAVLPLVEDTPAWLDDTSIIDQLLTWPMLAAMLWWALLLGRFRQAFLYGITLCQPSVSDASAAPP